MDLSVQQLRMLREVADHGTIAAAADQLGYTASAVSQQLASIERVTGVAVLEKSGRNVLLTDAGRELVVHARRILDQLEEARAAVELVRSHAAGTLRVGMIESVANTLLPSMLHALSGSHPDLDIRTRQTDPDLSAQMVKSGELDLAFTVDYPNTPANRDPRLERALVCNDWFHAVVPLDDPIETAAAELGEFSSRRLIASPPDLACGRCVVLACRAAGFEPDLAHEIEDYPTVLQLVAAGAGVGLVPELGLRDLPNGVRIVDLKVPVCRTVDLIWRASSTARPAVTAFTDAMVAAATELGLDR